MSNILSTELILAGLFRRGSQKLAQMLDESYFENPQEKAFIKEMANGNFDIAKIRENTGLPLSYMVGIKVDQIDWITESDIEEFKKEHLQLKLESLIQSGDLNAVRKELLRTSTYNKSTLEEYEEFKNDMNKVASSGLIGFSTGLSRLDYATKGFGQGHIWVIGGYRGSGKTFVLLNFVKKALDSGKRCLIFSLEMTSGELIARLIGLETGLDMIPIYGNTPPEKKKQVEEVESKYLSYIDKGLLIIDTKSRSSAEIISRLLAENDRKHVDLVGMDYIQLVNGDKSIYDTTSEFVKSIQEATKRTRCTTILLSQINNEAAKEGQNRVVDGFKGSGDIGQVANVAITMHREFDEESGRFTPLLGLRIVKLRHGNPQKLEMEFKFPGGIIVDKMEVFDDLQNAY